MLFAEVEGGRALMRRKPGLAHMVHTALTRLLQVGVCGSSGSKVYDLQQPTY
jgi:hypothetical protein